jgi:hypothetical protein
VYEYDHASLRGAYMMFEFGWGILDHYIDADSEPCVILLRVKPD